MSARNARDFNRWMEQWPDWVFWLLAAALVAAVIKGCLVG
jgi:hypothetical protein